MKNRLFTLFLLVIVSGIIKSQNQTINIQKPVFYIGERNLLTFQIELKQKPQKIIFPEVETDTSLKFIELLEKPFFDTVYNKDSTAQIYRKKYLFTSFDSGVHVIPPLRIEAIINDSLIISYASDTLKIEVKLAQVDLQADIKDIKTIWNVPFNWLSLLKYLYILLGLIIIGFLIYWYYRKKKGKPLFEKKEPPRLPPYEEALEKLNRIKQEALWKQGLFKEYYTQLTDAIRVYIERRFEIPAMEQTSYETIKELKEKTNHGEELLKDVEHLFSVSDLVKFAKATPLSDENENCLNIAFEFLEKTKPIDTQVNEAQKQKEE